jgi:hypothetical protein
MRYAAGEITREELNVYVETSSDAAKLFQHSAANSAYNAVNNTDCSAFDTAYFAGCALANSAYHAANGNVYISNCPVYHKVFDEHQKQTADICRELLTDAVFEVAQKLSGEGAIEVIREIERRNDFMSRLSKIKRNRNISRSVRIRLLSLNRKCAFCGSTENLTIDHIVPISKGGSNKEENLQVLCRSCNEKKALL